MKRGATLASRVARGPGAVRAEASRVVGVAVGDVVDVRVRRAEVSAWVLPRVRACRGHQLGLFEGGRV